MTSEQWFIHAEAYFSNTMSVEEARSFERNTAESTELTQLMTLWKLIEDEGSAYEKHHAEVKAFSETHLQLKKDFIGTRQFVIGWKWVAAAAVVSGIIFVGTLIFRDTKKKPQVVINNTADSSKKSRPGNLAETVKPDSVAGNKIQLATLYAQNFSADDVPDDQSGPLADAYFYYASHQYRKAIQAIDSAGNKQDTRGGAPLHGSESAYANYYKALSLMSLARYDSAVPLLKQVEKSSFASLKSKARWYLSLAHLQQNDASNSIRLLETLAGDPAAGVFQKKARKLLLALRG